MRSTLPLPSSFHAPVTTMDTRCMHSGMPLHVHASHGGVLCRHEQWKGLVEREGQAHTFMCVYYTPQKPTHLLHFCNHPIILKLAVTNNMLTEVN